VSQPSQPVSDTIEDRITGEPLMAHLATAVDDRPHVAPVWYAYEDGIVELVTTGRKLANVRENPRVALSIQRDTDGSAEWAVTLLGTATVVEEASAVREVTGRLNERYGASVEPSEESALVRVDIGSASYQSYD